MKSKAYSEQIIRFICFSVQWYQLSLENTRNVVLIDCHVCGVFFGGILFARVDVRSLSRWRRWRTCPRVGSSDAIRGKYWPPIGVRNSMNKETIIGVFRKSRSLRARFEIGLKIELHRLWERVREENPNRKPNLLWDVHWMNENCSSI